MISLTNTLITILVAIVDCGFMLDKCLSTAVNSLNISHNRWLNNKEDFRKCPLQSRTSGKIAQLVNFGILLLSPFLTLFHRGQPDGLTI